MSQTTLVVPEVSEVPDDVVVKVLREALVQAEYQRRKATGLRDWLTVKEVAHYFGVNPWTIRKAIKTGQIPNDKHRVIGAKRVFIHKSYCLGERA